MKKITLLLGLILTSTLCSFGQRSVTVGWDVSCNTNIVGYTLYYSSTSIPPAITNVVSSYTDDCGVVQPLRTNIYYGKFMTNTIAINGRNNTSCTVSNLALGKTYYFTVTSRTLTLESDVSTEVSYTVPLFPTNVPPTRPEGFRINSVQ